MDKHCVSLEIAKQLKEVGWKKETEFWWVYNKLRDEHKICYGLSDCCKNHSESWEYYHAPLATEILEELPKKDDSDNLARWRFEIELTKGGMYYCRYDSIDGREIPDNSKEENEDKWVLINDKSLPNALAKMWLYLRKEKL